MSLNPAEQHRSKCVAEHGACFGLAIGALVVVAVLLQWLLQLAP